MDLLLQNLGAIKEVITGNDTVKKMLQAYLEDRFGIGLGIGQITIESATKELHLAGNVFFDNLVPSGEVYSLIVYHLLIEPIRGTEFEALAYAFAKQETYVKTRKEYGKLYGKTRFDTTERQILRHLFGLWRSGCSKLENGDREKEARLFKWTVTQERGKTRARGYVVASYKAEKLHDYAHSRIQQRELKYEDDYHDDYDERKPAEPSATDCSTIPEDLLPLDMEDIFDEPWEVWDIENL